jgi:CubicO group peptidase (beta-lactamase class C family)
VAAAVAPPRKVSLVEQLDAAVDAAVDSGAIVGAVVMAASHGHLLYQRAAGWCDREEALPAQESDVFRLASMTKLIVSVAALRLCERGTLALDSPVTRWLPGFRPRLADGSVPPILLRHLLSHTAGLCYGFERPPGNAYEAAGISDGLDLAGFDLEENLRRIASVPLLFAPGTGWQYSLATDVVGAVLQRATGLPLPEVIAREVTAPLDMSLTGFQVPRGARLATAYRDDAAGPRRVGARDTLQLDTGVVRVSADRVHDPRAYPCAGAGMVGTAADYLRLLECLRRGGAPLLTEASTRALLGNAIGEVAVPSRGPGWTFGLGPLVLADPRQACSVQGRGTWLWGGVYGGHYWVDPVHALSLVALTNTGVAGLWGAFPDSLVAALYSSQRAQGL